MLYFYVSSLYSQINWVIKVIIIVISSNFNCNDCNNKLLTKCTVYQGSFSRNLAFYLCFLSFEEGDSAVYILQTQNWDLRDSSG